MQLYRMANRFSHLWRHSRKPFCFFPHLKHLQHQYTCLMNGGRKRVLRFSSLIDQLENWKAACRAPIIDPESTLYIHAYSAVQKSGNHQLRRSVPFDFSRSTLSQMNRGPCWLSCRPSNRSKHKAHCRIEKQISTVNTYGAWPNRQLKMRNWPINYLR